MKTSALIAGIVLLLAGCINLSDDDRDRDKNRSKGEERARSHCVAEANSRGMRVESAGQAQKVGKKQYEVKLRIDAHRQHGNSKKQKKKNDDYRVLCQYDDKSRRARID